jgi:type IV pilus assembly protein PilQ
LIGDSALVAVAASYLRQLDLRQRQVAVKVQILNIDLQNDATIDSSFSARFGNTFLVSQNGRAYMNFGENKPGGVDGTGIVVDGTEYITPGSYSAGTEKVQAEQVFPPYVVAQERVETTNVLPDGSVSRSVELVDKLDNLGRPVYVPSSDPSAAFQSRGLVDSLGRPILVPGQNSNEYTQPKNSFYSYLEAAIVASSAKTLAQPTLLVQEGQKAVVKTATSVITGVNSTEASNGSVQYTNTRAQAGLILDVMVNKIDDNGFITLELKPSVSVPQPAGTQQGVQIFNISERSLSSGAVRLRDGQTLVVTGVITDDDRQRVTKWPVLGDMPIIGQLFRQSSSNRQKSELVMLVTPTLVDDVDGGAYGYGYRPMTQAAREFLR